MKLFLALLCLFFTTSPAPLFIVDKAMKKPLKEAEAYTTQDYLQHTFPIYTSDKEALIAAADKAAKWIERVGDCYVIDSIQTAHTTFRLLANCEGGLNVSVIIFTKLDETATTYSFLLVEKEADKRKAQEKLMDFAMYIDQ